MLGASVQRRHYPVHTRVGGRKRLLQRAKQRFGPGAAVAAVVADVHIQRHQRVFRPGVDRQMRFGQHHRACDALPRAKAVEQAADDGQACVRHSLAAERFQRAGIGHARGTRAAAVQVADQVQAGRPAGAPRGGVAVGVF
jgi:hypothetical protein